MNGRVLTVGGRRAARGLLLGKDLFYEVRLADMKHFLFQKCVVFSKSDTAFLCVRSSFGSHRSALMSTRAEDHKCTEAVEETEQVVLIKKKRLTSFMVLEGLGKLFPPVRL